MPSTYTPISTSTTTTNGVANITFSSIPAIYTDLVLVISGGINAGVRMKIQFNGDTGGNYNYTSMRASSSSSAAESSANTNACFIGAWHAGTSGNPLAVDNATIYIANYANTNVKKTVVSRTATSQETWNNQAWWNNTAAINSITFLSDGVQTINAGTVASLYGVKVA